MTRISICALLALAVFAGGTWAQCPGLHPTVSLTLNGTDPGTVAGGTISTGAPYNMDLDVVDSGGANMPLILIAGSNLNCGAVPAIPGQLSIDVDGPQVVLDGTGTGLGIIALAGLGNTPMNISMAFPTTIWGGANGPALQAIVADPAYAVPFVSTSAGAMFFANATTTSYFLPDDGGVAHNLVGAGVMFGGGMENPICLNSNGQITFGAITGDFSPTLPEHFNGWGTVGNNGVSLYYKDLNRTALGAWTDITENLITGDVTVDYRNQNHWNSQEPAGDFSASFVGPLLTLDYSGLIAQVSGTDNVIIGVTNGDSANGTDTDLSVINGGAGTLGSLGTYVSMSSPDSIGDELLSTDEAALIANGQINYLDVGAYSWTIF